MYKRQDDRLLLHLLLRDITEIYAGGIALVFHIQAELLLRYGRSQIINVLHHQPPVARSRIVTGILERFHEECLLGIAEIGCKLAHPVSYTHLAVVSTIPSTTLFMLTTRSNQELSEY